MSAVQHDDAAAAETKTATADRADYNPNAKTELLHCGPFQGNDNDLVPQVPPPCWSEYINPTSHFLAESQQHERVARAHEAASAQERAEEDKACTGVSERDRHTSILVHNKDIVSIAIDRDAPDRLIGATIIFADVPGLTASWLQSVVDCHRAMHAVTDRGSTAEDDSPLAGPGVTALAVQHGPSTELILRGDSDAVVKRIVQRAEHQQSMTRVGPVSAQ